jgi:hypothetical protein
MAKFSEFIDVLLMRKVPSMLIKLLLVTYKNVILLFCTRLGTAPMWNIKMAILITGRRLSQLSHTRHLQYYFEL